MNNNKWDKRFLELARLVSTWSKDPSSKIGAVAVDPSNRNILSLGYNGFPRNIEDSEYRLTTRETKLQMVVHAEMNCIYNASFNGVCLRDSHLYVFGLPVCSDCAKGVVQVGVSRVVMPKQSIPDSWTSSWERSSELFREAGVEYVFLQ